MKNSDNEDDIQTVSNTQSDNERLLRQREWIVKSNSRILGPYSFDEISQQLRENRLVPHDEVALPSGRWHILRQVEVFREVLNEIRNRPSTKMDQIMDATVAHSVTITDTTELPEEDFRNSEKLTENIERDKNQSAESKGVESRDLVKTYGYSKDSRMIKKIGKVENIKITVALIIFFLACIGSIFKFSQKQEKAKNKVETFGELLAQGVAAENVGDYSKALTIYSEARNLKPNDNVLLYRLAPLTFIYENQSLQASRMFKQLLETDKNTDHQMASYTGLGLIALEAHELDVAMENFSKVLLMESQNLPAIFNIGVVNFYKNKFEDAEQFIRKALERGGDDGAVVISMADVNVAAAEGENSRKNLTAAHEMLKAYLESGYDYIPQVLIQNAHVLARLGKINEASKNIEAILNLDPEEGDMFLRDWKIYRGRASWDQTLSTLRRTLPSLNMTPRMEAVEGFIMYLGRERLEGATKIEKALSLAPKDPLIMAMAGWIEWKLGRRDVATLNINEAAATNVTFKLPRMMKARLCFEEKNMECAEKYWSEILRIDQRCLAAYYGLSKMELQKHDISKAVFWLRQGQAMQPKYIPFNILNAEIEASRP